MLPPIVNLTINNREKKLVSEGASNGLKTSRGRLLPSTVHGSA